MSRASTREPEREPSASAGASASDPPGGGSRRVPGEHGPQTGRVIGGRYKLSAPLAEGGMGSVWRAEHVSLGHAVAVKFLAGGSAASSEHRTRFEREARLAARIAEESRHVVKVTDHGVEPDGTPWLVMELLHGEPLDRRLRRDGGRIPLALAAEIVRQVARGLEVAHRSGVIHRDLKPANVFLCSELAIDDLARGAAAEDVHAKILDFGVAKSMWDDDEAPTREGIVLGTPGYMSPEQLSGEATVDARTDVWALGAIAYRAIVGRPAFGVGTTAEIAARIAASEPTPPSELVSELPAELDAVLARALAKEVDARFRSALELGEALHRVAALARAEESLQSTNDGAVVSPRASSPRARRRSAAALALLLLCGVSITFVLLRRPADPPSAAAPGSPTHEAKTPEAKPQVEGPPLLPAIALASAPPSPPPAASASASASALPVAAPKPKLTPRKVIDTWHKKDEL